MSQSLPRFTLCPYTTLFRSLVGDGFKKSFVRRLCGFDLELERDGFFDETLEAFVAFSEVLGGFGNVKCGDGGGLCHNGSIDRKSTRLNSSHRCSSYAVFCLK